MFVAQSLRTVRVSTVRLGSMFLFGFIFILLVFIVQHLLIPKQFTDQASYGIFKSQLFSFSKRYFFSGGSTNYNGQQSNGYQGATALDSSGAQFSYKTAVAYQPKDRDDKIYQNLKDSLKSLTGEDNYFITANSASDLYAGVADGVGGWAEHGYDSSAISRELCKAIGDIASTLSENSADINKLELLPKDLMDYAYSKIKKDEIVKVGGTTSIVAHFQNNGLLKIANLGDSWCGVFRDSKLVFQTKFQTVGFNAPYQLSIIPDQIAKEAARNGNSYIQNTPKDADEYSFQLTKDDIVILATDGVTDNIATDDIELFLTENTETVNTNLQGVATDFVDKVVALSKDPNYPSVFAQEISKLTGKPYRGGKEDDITVIVVKVD